MQRYIVLEKAVGETPLACVEKWRSEHPEYTNLPLAYAGRLDPLASGKLLVLIGEECKRQTAYHQLDKGYEFEVVFGLGSDTGDVMGLLTAAPQTPSFTLRELQDTTRALTGSITLPYPAFSAKTVAGKPLHTWTLEGRLHEITLPTKRSTIYTLGITKLTTISAEQLYHTAIKNINTIPPVTDSRKALGNDFRRPEIRQSWEMWLREHQGTSLPAASLTCTVSSGTYMRTLAGEIAKQLNTLGLATRIHRTDIGTYQPLPLLGGVWTKRYQDRD